MGMLVRERETIGTATELGRGVVLMRLICMTVVLGTLCPLIRIQDYMMLSHVSASDYYYHRCVLTLPTAMYVGVIFEPPLEQFKPEVLCILQSLQLCRKALMARQPPAYD